MGGLVCLQGGAEFGASCRDLDLAVLRRTPPGPIVVLPGAAAPGRDYATAGRNAARYYRGLSGDAVTVTPDPRDDDDEAVRLVAAAALLVLPGGSPQRLHEVLTATALGGVVRERSAAGELVVSGASAGAMVACAVTVLPERGREVVSGLGLVPGLALPHWSGTDRFHSRDLVAPGVPRWGLPECGGVLVEGDRVVAAGAGTPQVLVDDDVRDVPRGPQSTPLAALLDR